MLSPKPVITCLSIFFCMSCSIEPYGPTSKEEKNDTQKVCVTGGYHDLTESSVTLYGYANLTSDMTGDIKLGIACSTDLLPDQKNGISLTTKDLNAENQFFVSFSGLKSETKYYYRAFVFRNNIYTYGEVKDFVTPPLTPIVVTKSYSSIDNCVTLTGTVSPSSTRLSATIGFFWGDAPDPRQWVDATGDTTFSTEINDLIPGKTYYYKAAVRYRGIEYYGEVKTFSVFVFEQKKVALVVDDEYQLGLTGISGSESVYYRVGDVTVATVSSSGLVKAQKPGQTRISSIKWNNNQSIATCDLIVEDRVSTPDEGEFHIDVLEIQDMDIKVRVTPSNPSIRYYVAFVESRTMDGYSDEQATQRIINMLSYRIDENTALSWANLPDLEAGTREMWGRRDGDWDIFPSQQYSIYAFGIDENGSRSTSVSRIDVTTASSMASNNTFQMEVVSNSWLGLDYTIIPEIAEEYWMPFLAETSNIDQYFRNADGTLKEKILFEWIEKYYEDELPNNCYHGTKTLHAQVTPDMNYSLIVFGFSGSYTTRMYEFKLYVPAPPLGKSTADFTYTYELFRGEDLSAIDPVKWPMDDYGGDCIMVMRVTPTANAKHWYLGIWGPIENYQNQGGKPYLMKLDMNPDVPGSSMQDKKFWRNRPWWYGMQQGYVWRDEAGDIVKHWPWSISGWAEDEDGNYGPWHYELFIPIPLPKEQVTGKYEVGYSSAYDFWSNPSSASTCRIISLGKRP